MLNPASGWRTALFVGVLVAPAMAVETRVWDQSEMADFSRGSIKNLALRSDGHIALGAAPKELDSTSVPYLWAVARDSAGTIYYAGGAPTGATTKVFRLQRNGKPSVLAEIPGLEIHALAVDKQDRLYAAILPDAKIYRVDKTGKPQLFFDAKCKYIWAMAFDAAGNLFVGTGDTGVIYRVTPDGNGTKFFDSEENHVRSLIIDSSGNLIAGTEPSGLVIRITPAGQSFVLYETNKREVTAVAEHNGQIYAASVGSKIAPAVITGPAPVLPPSNPTPATGVGTPRPATPPTAAPALGSISANITGGSEIYRIGKDGFAERIWQSSSDLAYALAFDSAGHPLIGTGNKGIIYRVDSDQLWTQVASMPPTQVTAFLQDGTNIYAATGNVGNLYLLSPDSANTGTLTSDVFDAHGFALWGKAHVTADKRRGTVLLETRSGNVNNPENHWSPWSAVNVSAEGGQLQSPPARFLQYRLTLKCEGSDSPDVSVVDIAYLTKNIAPRVRVVEVAPFNYRPPAGAGVLERNVNAAGSPVSLTLPPIGQKRGAAPGGGTEGGSGATTLQYSKGFLTIRWASTDANEDTLQFKVELRAKDGGAWRTLKDKLTDHFYSFDTTAFPDGEYVARVTASDAPANIPSEALTGSLDSDPFHIDNTAPDIVDVKTTAAPQGGTRVTWTAKDATSWLAKAEYSVDGGEWALVNPENKVTDSRTLSYELLVPAGQSLALRVFDENDNVQVKQVTLR